MFFTFVTVLSDFINDVQYKSRSGKPVNSHQSYQEKDHLKFHLKKNLKTDYLYSYVDVSDWWHQFIAAMLFCSSRPYLCFWIVSLELSEEEP